MVDRVAIPDILWPSDNEWDVPVLDPDLQAESVDLPIVSWGRRGRRRKAEGGTIHFYCDDYKFTALWKDPRPLLKRGPRNIVEPNFSTNEQMPMAVGLYRIYQKRWLARWWQSRGLRVFVDLCVADKFRAPNMLGVPEGWKAYATRAYADNLGALMEDRRQATAKCDRPIILVVGGGIEARALCKRHGMVWIGERVSARRFLYRGESHADGSAVAGR